MSEWVRVISLGDTPERTRGMFGILNILLKLGSKLYTKVYVENGLFGLDVRLKDWKKYNEVK